MTFAEILDTGFRLLRDHFVLLTVIAGSINVPIIVARDLLMYAVGHDPALVLAVLAGMVVVVTLVSPIVGVAATHAIGEVYLGREVTIGDAFRKAIRIIVPVVGTSFLAALAVFGGMVLVFVPGVWVWLGLAVLSPIMVLEARYGGTAIARSLELMKGHRTRAFGIFFVAIGGQLVLVAGIGAALGAFPVAGTVAEGAIASLAGAYTAAVAVVLYFDIRCRKEAFEVEQLARVVEAGTPGPAVS